MTGRATTAPMRDVAPSSATMPLDQADGLRRLFADVPAQRVLALASNPHVAFTGVAIERLTHALTLAGRHVLVVDAADTSPPPHEWARLDLAAAVERLGPRVSYLAARGLPLAHVDARGSSAAFLDAASAAEPAADVVLVHATASDLARLFGRRALRPLVLGADQPEAIKHAYAVVKLLARRCGLMTFDLLLAAAPSSPRLRPIADSLAGCADRFVDATLHAWAVLDPAAHPLDAPADALQRLLAAQLALDAADTLAPAAVPGPSPAAAAVRWR